MNTSTVNSNDLAEQREQATNASVQTLADDCDPVPIVRLPPQKTAVLNADPVTTDGTGPDQLVSIVGESWLGHLAENDTLAKTETFAYRHCTCFDSQGVPLPLDQCVGLNKQCRWDNPADSQFGEWNVPTLFSSYGSPVQLDASGFSLMSVGFSATGAQPLELAWAWRADLQTNKVQGTPDPCGADPYSCKTHGAIFTRTRGPVASPRDASASLRDVFQMYDTPAYLVIPPFPTEPPPPCKGSCLRWYSPRLWLVQPEVFDFPNIFDGPVVLGATPGGGVEAFVAGAAAIDIAGYVSPAVRALVADDTQLWLTPVEPLYRVRRATNRGAIQAVGFPRNLRTSSEITAVFGTASGLSGGPRIGPGAELSLPNSGPTPRERDDVRAVFSAVEQAVYMVGGRALDGSATGAIWRYSIGDKTWQIIAPNAPVEPSANVVAVAYDERLGQLYVLDRVPGPDGQERARLAAYDVRTGGANELARWPYLGLNEELWLTAAEDGALLLTARKKQTYSVWRLRRTASGVSFEGVFAAPGRVVGQPVMDEHEPVLGVERKGKLEYVSLASSLFHGHVPCVL